MISCLLLSAGESKRFGSPKALARIAQQTIIEHLQALNLNSGIEEIIIVLGPHAPLIEPHIFKHKQIRFVHNIDYKFGQTSSVQIGLKSLSPMSQGFLLWPVDFPFIQKLTITTLIEHFKSRSPLITIPTYLSRSGHPPLLHNSLKKDLLNLPVSEGINSYFQQRKMDIQYTSVNDEGILLSFNTPEEFIDLQKRSKNSYSL